MLAGKYVFVFRPHAILEEVHQPVAYACVGLAWQALEDQWLIHRCDVLVNQLAEEEHHHLFHKGFIPCDASNIGGKVVVDVTEHCLEALRWRQMTTIKRPLCRSCGIHHFEKTPLCDCKV